MSVLLSAPDFWCYVENFLNRKCDFSFTLGEIYLPSSLLAVLPSFFSSSLPTEVYWTPTMYYRPIPCQTFGMEWWVKPTPSLTSQSFPSRMAFLNHKRSWGKGEIKGSRRIQGVWVMGVFLRKWHRSWNPTGNQLWEGEQGRWRVS